MKLGEVIDLDSLQGIQDCFAAATGFAAITVDYQGKPLLEYSGFSNFCSKLREDPYYSEKCNQSDAHGSLEAVRRNAVCIYRCHAGLVDFAVPIIVDGEYVASMMCGQILAEEGQDVSSELMKPSDNIFTQKPELLELFNSVSVLPFKRIKETANLLYLTLNYIVEQYLLNQKNLRLISEQKEKAELEKQFKDLEIRFYHSQINPHFLFNALNVAGRQAFLEGAKKTQEIIYSLADIYRYNLDNSGFLISVAEEVQNLKNYMFIQHIRFGEQLKFIVNVDSNMNNYQIPAMSLQIFVENAVRHGLEKKEDLGYVKIKGYFDESKMHFEITDNGIGIPSDLVYVLNNSEFYKTPPTEFLGMGIYNIHKRLQYFFPGNYSIKYHSLPDKGTKVVISLPYEIAGE